MNEFKLKPMGESQVHPTLTDGSGSPMVLGDSSGNVGGRGWLRMAITEEGLKREKEKRDRWYAEHRAEIDEAMKKWPFVKWECLVCGWIGKEETSGCPRCHAHADELVKIGPNEKETTE